MICVGYEIEQHLNEGLSENQQESKLNCLIASWEACLLRFSFTKADRILKRHEFIALSATGRKIQNEHFIAVFAPNRHGRSRIGVTVTKKIGSAVKRNRIKRIVREYFRLNRHNLKGDWDINLIAKKHEVNFSAEQAHRSLENIFERISSKND